MKLHTLIAAAMLSAAGASHAGLIHQYELNGSLADAKGGKALESLGGVLGADGYAFTQNKGLKYDYALSSQYTVDMVFRLDTVAGSYKRLLDFQAPASPDHGMYLWYKEFCYYATGGCHGDGTMEASSDVRLTVTRDAAARVTFYQNGTQVYSFVDASGQALADGSRRLRFFDDDGGESATGSVDFIHIYDNVLSQQEVRALNGVDLPEPAPLGLIGAGLALAGWTRRRRARAAA